MKGRGPRPKPVAPANFGERLLIGDRQSGFREAGWFRDPELLSGIGPALADLAAEDEPDLVLAPQSRGTLLGALVANHLGIGLIELRKHVIEHFGAEGWLAARTPLDYRHRNLELGIPAGLLPTKARILFVDDWIDTGGQLMAARAVTELAGAHWCGAAVVVDGLDDPRLRHEYTVRSLLRRHEL